MTVECERLSWLYLPGTNSVGPGAARMWWAVSVAHHVILVRSPFILINFESAPQRGPLFSALARRDDSAFLGLVRLEHEDGRGRGGGVCGMAFR